MLWNSKGDEMKKLYEEPIADIIVLDQLVSTTDKLVPSGEKDWNDDDIDWGNE